MLSWLVNLFSASPTDQVVILEQRIPTFEERLEKIIHQSRAFQEKNQEELNEFIEEVSSALGIIEQAVDVIDRDDLVARAVRVRTRLRKAKTRAINSRRVA
jgi:Na+/phosphate symporter